MNATYEYKPMNTKRSTYKLDGSQLDRALEILKKEYTLSRRQKKLLNLLNIALYGFLLCFSFMILEDFLVRKELIIKGSGFEVVLFEVLGLSVVAFLASILILFTLSGTLLWNLWRQSRHVRTLGLSEVLKAPWKAERRKRRTRNIFTLILPGLWLLFNSFLLDRLAGDEDPTEYQIAALAIIWFVSLALFVMHFLRRGKEQLEVVARLQDSLSDFQEKAAQTDEGSIDVSSDTYEQIAQIERAQITRDRAESILAGPEKPGDATYFMQKSRTVREALAHLDATTKLRVHDQIDALITEPHPAGATENPDSKTWRLRVPDTLVDIHYKVDKGQRFIMILSLELDDEATVESDLEG